MTNPTPEQIEARNAALEAWQEGSEIRRYSEFFTSFEDGYNAALAANAGVSLVAPALPVRDDRSQSGGTDRNGGEDGPEHEWGSHPETVAADTAELIAEARSRAEHPGTGSNTAQCLRECADALEAAGNAPVQVDEAKLAQSIADELETDDAISEGWSSGKLSATARRLVKFAVLPVLRGGGR